MIAWVRSLVHGRDRGRPRDSEVALENAREAREQAEARQPVVEAVAAKLRRAREENHLRERIEELFKGAPS
ncbi:hypothetical protein PYK79_11000 [Streptomyces sp. ID05-04B]|uniref:DUF7620 family protein n=1 Tax=Streptomyces sp. ID05-04B TaxID=3028661 RepID=UPI0029C522A1|nr:hypothetical protein [Streptomyces sp. ID05-04B]MDX5563781.1 hypothetical protein [Streptomyces sp. ID05-04B]